jgi:site-specific recombinase XerD
MGPYIAGFEAWLLELGYTDGTTKGMLAVAGQLGRWMASEGLAPSQLTDVAIDGFRGSRHAGGYRRVPSARALRPLLAFLRCEGVVVSGDVAPASSVEMLVCDYRTWLVAERALAAPTVLRYESTARRFLMERAASDGDRFIDRLSGREVVAFLLAETARVRVGAAKARVGELRSLLRFLYVKGLTPVALGPAVPPVAGWRDTGIPVGVAAVEVELVLDGCDRADAGGIRDFAILMLVARMGLRSIEVARLELGDIDWRAGEIVVRGKARRRDRLPLPCDVGEAVTAYLCDARPPTQIRQVFLGLTAPTRAIRADLVGDVTRRACDRAGVPRVGPHRLRHALATEMLRRGATLVEVSQVLRHQDLATTAIYAKVDFATLRRVAQPWPGAQ